MIPHPTLHWNEILAAYADGELEGRDDLASLKQRVEDWLAQHPEGGAELAQYRQLKQAWQATSAPAPEPAVWDAILQDVEKALSRPAPDTRKTRQVGKLTYVTAALAACVALVVTIWLLPRPERAAIPVAVPVVQEEEPFPVAAAHEVEILNVEGADTGTLVVGAPPVQGPLELAAPGDVTVTSVQPAARDNMIPEMRLQGPGRPMIWARAETD